MSLKKAADAVKNNHNFIITSHVNLEGDALGSEIAFYNLLKRMDKKAIIVNNDDTPVEYDFLPGINRIKKFRESLVFRSFDCFVALDCSDISRCGKIAQINRSPKLLLNIDHHISNTRFGDINWVEPKASSCAQMVYELYKKLRVPLDRDTATLLYVGMLTDTGSFHYPNTASPTHKAVAELLGFGLDVTWIYKQVYENIPFAEMKLVNSILSTMRLDAAGRVAWIQIKRPILKRHKDTSFDLTEYLLHFARAIKGVEVAALFKENLNREDGVRVNLRSQGKVDVNRIAQAFGGGGHKTASGATVHGSLDAIRKQVLNKIQQALK